MTLLRSDSYAHVAEVQTLAPLVVGRVLKPAPDVLARRMPGGAVLVHLPSNRIFELNETGARVWELLSEGVEGDALIERLGSEFAVDRVRLRADVDAVLDRLGREGLLSTV